MESSLSKQVNIQLMEVENLEVDLRTPVESHADPLQETPSHLTTSCFKLLFKDEDIFMNYEQQEVRLVESGRVRGKCNRDEEGPLQVELLVPNQEACGKGPARSVSNAVEAWVLLFDDEMLRMVLHLINKRIQDQRTRGFGERILDLTELRSWLGLKYLCGVFRNAKYNGPLEELWTIELGNPIFRATMTLERFKFITNCLSFHNESSSTNAESLWQKLLINCRSYYGASGWLSVDSYSANEDVLLGLCCDAKTLYMTNALIIKQNTTSKKELMHLICDYKTTGRNVTLGSRYGNVTHCEQLLQCHLTSICILQPSFLDCAKGKIGGTLLNGSMILTEEQEASILTCGMNRQLNPTQVLKYTSQTCAHFHELSNRYSASLSEPRTPSQPDVAVKLLHLMLDVASVNAWILLRLSPAGDVNMEQRDFQRQLGLFLVQQRLQRRLHNHATTMTLSMRLQICEILGLPTQRLLSQASNDFGVLSISRATVPEGVNLVSRYGEKHRRCKPCARSKREIKARSRCQQCQVHRCGNHLISRCYECTGVTMSQPPKDNKESI